MYSALVLLDNQKRMMYYLMVLVLLFLAELFYFKIADKCNIIDMPNERSSHTKVTLRGGELSSTSVHWLIFWRVVLTTFGLCWH